MRIERNVSINKMPCDLSPNLLLVNIIKMWCVFKPYEVSTLQMILLFRNFSAEQNIQMSNSNNVYS